MECGNALAEKPSRRRLAEIRAEFAADGTLVNPSSDEIEAAWNAYARGEAGDAGSIDHVSFAVMGRLGLTRAFTNDAHFRASGFETLF